MSRTQIHRVSPPLLPECDRVSLTKKEAERIWHPVHLSTESCPMSTLSDTMDLITALWTFTGNYKRSPHWENAPEPMFRVTAMSVQNSPSVDLLFVLHIPQNVEHHSRDPTIVSSSPLSIMSTATGGVSQSDPTTSLTLLQSGMCWYREYPIPLLK
jgi:hypothetical protein